MKRAVHVVALGAPLRHNLFHDGSESLRGFAGGFKVAPLGQQVERLEVIEVVVDAVGAETGERPASYEATLPYYLGGAVG